MTGWTLCVDEPVVRDGRIERSAVLRAPGAEGRRIWFAVDERHAEEISAHADAFVLASLRAAVAAGRPLRIEGAPTAPSLLSNLEEVQLAWRQWYGTEPVDVLADELDEPGRPEGAAVATFSGGVDSSYTLHRHATRAAGWRSTPPRLATMVHGFDIPLTDDGFAGAFDRARIMTDSLGVELVALRTNARELMGHWPNYFGLAGAAALSFISARSTTGLFAAGDTYANLVAPHGSTPALDPLLGSRSFPIIHDGSGARRIEKLAYLAGWPEAMRALRVCWAGEWKDRNCGRCRKCVTIAMMCRVLGIEPEFFDRPVTQRAVIAAARTAPTEEFSAEYREEILELAREREVRERWVGILYRAQLRYRLRRSWAELRGKRVPRQTVLRAAAGRTWRFLRRRPGRLR